MALVNIASSSPTAVRITDTPAPGADHGYVAVLVGNRDPNAVAGLGISYDVDEDVYTQWSATHPEIARAMRIVTQAEIDALAALEGHPATYGYEQGLKGPISTVPPVNVDIPYIHQDGSSLFSTLGNWEGEPTGYHFKWMDGATRIGTDSSELPITADMVGHVVVCVVRAYNAWGGTDAPPSNAITVTDAA